MNINQILADDKKIIDRYLEKIIPIGTSPSELLVDSMRYSILVGGKRIRPVIFMESLKMLGLEYMPYFDLACAIELIHTSSLIHDDLPAMDNDDLRRGKPTNHIVYGEAMAVLAGDSLINYAYEIIIQLLITNQDPQVVQAAHVIAKSAGIYGMMAGQGLDIVNENKIIDIHAMQNIHRNKTGALIEASMQAPATLAKVSDVEMAKIKSYSEKIGILFQIVDDILDVTGDTDTLGKNTNRDVENNKATYPKFYGLDGATQIADNLRKSAIKDIAFFGESSLFFQELPNYIFSRKN